MSRQILMLLTSWSALVTAYIVLLVWRKQLERTEDDTLHVLADRSVLSAQESMAHKMDLLERWSRILISLVILSGLVIAGIYMYSVWVSNTNATPV